MYYIIEKQHDRTYTNSMANYEYKTYQEAIEKLVALNTLQTEEKKKYTTFLIAEKFHPKD
jgi:hypothetical protein|tara:strand:- start:405 stop:584 length:180 start_codon:yes stop_codon:yes gene_type:complete